MLVNRFQVIEINVLNIYLVKGLRQYILSGKKHHFFSAVIEAFEGIGFSVNIIEDTDEARLQSMSQNSYALFHYKDPFHDNALDARSAYIGPFYKLENQTYRQDFRTTNKMFRPAQINGDLARKFFKNWQKTIVFQPVKIHTGAVFIPLQGKLTRCRIGQSMSPIEMIKTTQRLENTRALVIKKHPRESYSNEELTALDQVLKHPRTHLVEDDLGNLLAGCAYVVTQNSSVALKGLFHRKPGILFAHSEFHHAFQSVQYTPVEQCFAHVLTDPPPFAKFLFWYLQRNCINTSRDFVKDRILQQCREFGWKI